MKSVLRAFPVFVCILFAVFPKYCFSDPIKTLVDIKDLNYDCVPDTLIGSYNNATLRIDCIVWGIDSAIQAFPKNYSYVDTTRFVYPAWERIRTYNNIASFNLDTIPDIMCFVQGKVEIDSQLVDTAVKVVIYGQYGLDSVSVINIGGIIFPMQIFPIKAKHILVGQDLVNCAARKYDFTVVMEMVKSATTYPPPPSVENPMAVGDQPDEHITIYPNPSQTQLTIDIGGLTSDLVMVEIYSMDGILAGNHVYNSQSDVFRQTLDISMYPNGSYFLVLRDMKRIIHSYKFIKTR